MRSYYTPGVYVEETPILPPSVVQNETAIPVFVGYTQKHDGIKPRRITSMVEYHSVFGGAYVGDADSIDNPENYIPPYLLYYQLQMFFNNGGAACYVMSVGGYKTESGKDKCAKVDFDTPLKELEKEDEPTLILLTDAINLPNNEYHGLCQNALSLCEKRKNLFLVMDVRIGPDNKYDIEEFRTGIGTSNLKYGAAYFPYLKTTVSYPAHGSTVSEVLQLSDGKPFEVKLVVAADELKVEVKERTITVTGQETQVQNLTWHDFFSKLSAKLPDNITIQVPERIKQKLEKVKQGIEKLVSSKVFGLVQSSESTKTAQKGSQEALKGLQEALKGLQEALKEFQIAFKLNEGPETGKPIDKLQKIKQIIENLNKVIQNAVFSIKDGISDFKNLVLLTEDLSESAKELSLLEQKPFAKFEGQSQSYFFHQDESKQSEKKQKLSKVRMVLPPSGAIAGLYARVDDERGVWKAPANVSINGVIEPMIKITDEEQTKFNIDSKTGKSINVIRSFTGMGNIVWGARTMAGNDNEWRYISVRRLFNTIEDALRRSTRFVVFEPNNELTWLKVKLMCDNYLNDLWKQGGLAGNKAEEAYFVHVGSSTMTARDINEGKLIIEIGIAAVRPAEFVILRFSHLLQSM